jgi:hypothetical protein
MGKATDPFAVLDEMRTLLERKNHDYAQDANPFSNFEHAAAVAGVPVETVFLVMIGVKIARLIELTSSGKTPNNESIRDTRIDLANYATLNAAYHDRRDGVSDYF